MPAEIKDALWEEWVNRSPDLKILSLDEYRQFHDEIKSGRFTLAVVGSAKTQVTAEITGRNLGRLQTVTSEITAKVTPEITREVTGRLRHVTSEMNGLEKRYAQHLEMRKRTGEIREYRFEGLKLRLARATFWTPDFLIVMPDGAMELHEAKGHWEDDARVKIKWAAKEFAGVFRVVAVQWNKAMKDWKFEGFNV